MHRDTKKKQKPFINGSAHYTNLPRNWLHQGMTYMDNGEMSVRIFLEIIQILFAWCLLWSLGFDQFPIWMSLVVSIFLIHTFNWIANGNFWALMLFVFPKLKNRGERETCSYLNAMADRLGAFKSIGGLAIYGSISRNAWHDRSDVDIRIIRNPGLVNLLIVALLTMRERILSCLARQPLDLFLADEVTSLKRMRSDETPIFLLKRDRRLDEAYPDNAEIKLLGLCDLKVEVQKRL